MLYSESKQKVNQGICAALIGLFIFTLAACASNMAAKQDEPESIEASTEVQSKMITNIQSSDEADATAVVISGNQLLTYTSVKQPLPLGLVLYFPETSLAVAKKEYNVDNSVIGSIKASELIEQGPSKITISLKSDAPYQISREGSDLKISFNKPVVAVEEPVDAGVQEEAVEEESLAQAEQSEAVTEEAIQETEVASAPQESPEIAPAVEAPVGETVAAAETVADDAVEGPVATTLEAVQFLPGNDFTEIAILTNQKVQDFKSFTLTNPPRIVFDLADVKSPYKKQQTLPVGSPWVQQVRHFAYPERLRVVVETDEQFLSAFTATPTDQGLMIRVGGPPVETAAAESGSLPDAVPEETVTAEAVPEPEPEVQIPAEDVVEAAAAPATETAVAAATESAAAMAPDSGDAEQMDAPTEADMESPQETVVVEPQEMALVNRIDFISKDKGESSIIIGTTQPVEYKINTIDDKKLELELYNTKILSYRQRPLITTRFDSAVDRISPVQTPAMLPNAKIVVELREAVAYTAEQSDGQIQINFAASAVPPKPMEVAALPEWKKILEEAAAAPEVAPPPAPPETIEPTPPPVELPEVGATEEMTAEPLEPQEEMAAPEIAGEEELFADEDYVDETTVEKKKPAKKRYTGEKIALDFYQTDIKNVLRILRDVSGKNFAIDKDVTGQVTLTLVKPVPWDQVLDLILRMNQLGQISEGNIIRITTLATLKEEEKLKSEALKAQQNLKQAQKALEPLLTEYIPINYANAESDIKPRLEEIKTPDRGKIGVDTRNNQIIMTDTADKIEQAKSIVRRIDRVTPQVIIEARIVEVNDQFQRMIGTTWGMAGARTAASAPGTTSTSDWTIAMNHPPEIATGALGYNFSRIVGTPFSLNAELEAMESSDEGKIISAPKVVTLDNKEAIIKQGVEYPYQERDSSGLATVKFKQVDLELKVTPHVTPDNRITMKIEISKNDIASLTVQGFPSLSTNEATTELLVNDGDTIVIGGIIKSNIAENETRFPYLSRIPLLGWLFKSQSISHTKNELLIFITPRIVHLETHA